MKESASNCCRMIGLSLAIVALFVGCGSAGGEEENSAGPSASTAATCNEKYSPTVSGETITFHSVGACGDFEIATEGATEVTREETCGTEGHRLVLTNIAHENSAVLSFDADVDGSQCKYPADSGGGTDNTGGSQGGGGEPASACTPASVCHGPSGNIYGRVCNSIVGSCGVDGCLDCATEALEHGATIRPL